MNVHRLCTVSINIGVKKTELKPWEASGQGNKQKQQPTRTVRHKEDHRGSNSAARCLAPANPHERASSLIFWNKLKRRDLFLANVLACRSFKTSQLTSSSRVRIAFFWDPIQSGQHAPHRVLWVVLRLPVMVSYSHTHLKPLFLKVYHESDNWTPCFGEHIALNHVFLHFIRQYPLCILDPSGCGTAAKLIWWLEIR